MRRAIDAGWQVAIHVTGDGGLDLALDAFERVLRQGADRRARHRLEHVTTMRDDQLRRVRATAPREARAPTYCSLRPVSIPSPEAWRPTGAQVAAALGKTVPDVIAPGLLVLFCGINPGLYSGAVGHHFARPGNRFWKTLYVADFTEQILGPFEERELLGLGCGITNLVGRATATADTLSADELRRGARRLRSKVARYWPAFVAFLGLGAYRTAFAHPAASVGPQHDVIGGSRLWLLPNPSGLNAHYQLGDLAAAFGELRAQAFTVRRSRPSPSGSSAEPSRPRQESNLRHGNDVRRGDPASLTLCDTDLRVLPVTRRPAGSPPPVHRPVGRIAT